LAQAASSAAETDTRINSHVQPLLEEKQRMKNLLKDLRHKRKNLAHDLAMEREASKKHVFVIQELKYVLVEEQDAHKKTKEARSVDQETAKKEREAGGSKEGAYERVEGAVILPLGCVLGVSPLFPASSCF
jgi:hypothetical protein